MNLITKIKDVDIDLPVFKKFLFCLPLRPGLIFWGIAQMIATVLVGVYSTVEFAERSSHYHGYELVQMIILYMVSMIISLLEGLFCGFLVIGAQKKNANFLEVCYHYLKVKVPVYAGLLVVCFIVGVTMFSDYWFYRNLDSWRYLMLNDNMALGIIDWALQLYLLLLVRSEILLLQHQVDLTSLYKRLYAADQIQPVFTEKNEIADVC